jgi:hypothetical protein
MSSLFRYDVLVPVGVCLIVLGVALRSAHASLKRRLANERQDQQLSGVRTAAPRPLTHWERHVANYARAAIALGVLTTLVGFFRR